MNKLTINFINNFTLFPPNLIFNYDTYVQGENKSNRAWARQARAHENLVMLELGSNSFESKIELEHDFVKCLNSTKKLLKLDKEVQPVLVQLD